jgi:hypothetical protein
MRGFLYLMQATGKNELFSLIRVSGDDAASFLQGQLTQDVRKLDSAPALLAAWCNAKGRVIAVLRILAMDEAIGLIVPRGLAEVAVKRLSMFRLRANAQFDTVGDEWQAMAVTGGDDLAKLDAAGLLPDGGPLSACRKNPIVAFDTGSVPRCIEVFGPASAFRDFDLHFPRPHDDDAWRAALIAAGIPTITETTSERFTPHMLNLDLLGAISFAKGCYTGQEVVARTQHLGQAKRRLLRYRLESGHAASGDRLQHDDRDVGQIVDICGRDLLAIVPLTLRNETLRVAGQKATRVALPYKIP